MARRKSSDKQITNIILGALGGLAAGALAGLLLAPEKGKATRKKIADNASKLGTDVKNQVNSGWNTVSDKVSELTKKDKEEVAATPKSNGSHN